MQVVVLLSSYQGERFIREQLESILVQLPSGGQVFIRDDGSTDRTVDCILALQDTRISVVRGKNIGFVKSFFQLLHAAPEDADVIMLCDQDDVWLPNKIQRAVDHLQGLSHQPALYCSRLQLVNEELKPIGMSPAWPLPPSFRNALTENIVTGCTCALNRAALQLTRKHGNADLIYFHDWWLYLTVAAFGQVIVDPEPTILYRQHGQNAIGMGAGMSRYFSIFRFLNKKNWVHIMYNQIENFRALYAGQLSQENGLLLERYFDPHKATTTARLLLSRERFRQYFIYDILLRLLILGALMTGSGLLPKDSPPAK